ncbi:MAG: accessory factor UbiK family protein [Alphaproteobacteria bacterium]|nr:accessory factor UbiK family protein [Alphaproteobacteria bacterium]
MSKNSQFLDDIARVAGGTVGVLNNLREQLQGDIRLRVEELATRMDLVPREDLERVELMLEKALSEQKDMLKRLEKLEGKKTTKKSAKKKKKK